MITDKEILVLYYSQHGATRQMAQLIARGIGQVDGMRASHVAGIANDRAIGEAEKKLCMALGKRLAQTALKLAA